MIFSVAGAIFTGFLGDATVSEIFEALEALRSKSCNRNGQTKTGSSFVGDGARAMPPRHGATVHRGAWRISRIPLVPTTLWSRRDASRASSYASWNHLGHQEFVESFNKHLEHLFNSVYWIRIQFDHLSTWAMKIALKIWIELGLQLCLKIQELEEFQSHAKGEEGHTNHWESWESWESESYWKGLKWRLKDWKECPWHHSYRD